MVIVLLNWSYILFITFLTGFCFYKCLNKFVNCNTSYSLSHNIVCGIVVTTIYAQFFSIFHKVGLLANLFLFILCLAVLIRNKSELSIRIKKTLSILCSWEGVLYLGVLLLIAFCTSRGTIHTDTNLYHAQMIRWYETYGVVKGLANLQWHFAYNSSYFGFAALFSMAFLGGSSLHCTTGFLTALFCIWALHHLKNFFSHSYHFADLCCIGILFYALVNLTGCVSPASDYATMFFALYLITRWAEVLESHTQDITEYCLLSVLAVYIATLKLSAGLLVLLVLYPLVCLIRQKRTKEIITYLFFGIITLLPYLIRNVIISGWLLYPFPALDLFSFDWKLPVQYVQIDSAQIKTWARCLYDSSLIDKPFQEWLPIWWNAQERYAQMLLLTNILAVVLDVFILLHYIIRKKRLNWNLVLLNIVVLCNTAAWLFLAPFIRYGLAFLLATPALAVGMWMRKEKSSFYKLVSGCIVVLMFFVLTPYWDHYFTDDIVFIKQNLTAPYYLTQKEYDTSEMQTFDMNGITIYCPKEGEVTGYRYFPASAYDYMIQSTQLRGTQIKHGFRNTEFQTSSRERQSSLLAARPVRRISSIVPLHGYAHN